mmetsp:Transcript_28091/g.56944  ORF Transcript_28091/g.56944 Transcript_28091/m.56944 type:complete len:430 (+) Transcript_28091:130-1419(+)
MTMSTRTRTGAGDPLCPCCAFLPDDLFLPPMAVTEEEELSERSPSSRIAQTSASGSTTIETPTPQDALRAIKSDAEARRLVLVDTHTHPQLERNSGDLPAGDDDERGAAGIGKPFDDGHEQHGSSRSGSPEMITLVCSVSPHDWQSTLTYASEPSRYETTLPALGVHPWYLYPDLSPSYLSDLEHLLKQHPQAIVGEIGLCKVAKFVRNYPAELGGKQGALELQRTVFRDQFRLASRLRRPVSVHCVQRHGVLTKLFKEIMQEAVKVRKEWRKKQKESALSTESGDRGGDEPRILDAYPTAVAMHSYTGTAHHVKELLEFEERLHKEEGSGVATRHPMFYFGFSHAVNVAMCSSDKSRLQNIEAIRAVPTNRLLAESDVHCTADVEAGTAGAIAYLAAASGHTVLEMADITAKNGIEFLHSVRSKECKV